MPLEALLGVYEYSEAMHLALVKLANINVAISELECTITILLAILEVPLIFTTIGPLRFSLTFNATLIKLARESLL